MAWNAEIQMKFDGELNTIATSLVTVTHPGYQERPLSAIQSKNEELQEVLNNPTGNKLFWIAEVDKLKTELSALVEADNQVVVDNHDADASYQNTWMSELEANKANTDNKWSAVRNVRTWLLSLSDWTQLPDAPITTDKKTEWISYRQELRDLPKTYTAFESIIWPTKPE